MHSGEVIVGEIGIIKRDITQRRCDEHDSKNSEYVQSWTAKCWSQMIYCSLFVPENYVAKSVGAIRLRGKEKGVVLSSIELELIDATVSA